MNNKKTIMFLLSIIVLSSCTSQMNNEYEYKETIIEKNNNNSKINKDIVIEKKEDIEVIKIDKIEKKQDFVKKDIIITTFKEKNFDIELKNKYDYQKLQNGFSSEDILYKNKKRLDNLKKINYSNIPIQDQIEFDKIFIKSIFPSFYKNINSKIIFFSKKDILNSKTRDIKVNKTYYNENLEKREKTVLIRKIIIKNKLKIYKLDYNKSKFLLDDKLVIWLYYINWEIYPVTNNWLSGYIVMKYFDYLLKDKKYWILQYFNNEKTMLGLNWIDQNHVLIIHKKILKDYSKKILKFN